MSAHLICVTVQSLALEESHYVMNAPCTIRDVRQRIQRENNVSLDDVVLSYSRGDATPVSHGQLFYYTLRTPPSADPSDYIFFAQDDEPRLLRVSSRKVYTPYYHCIPRGSTIYVDKTTMSPAVLSRMETEKENEEPRLEGEAAPSASDLVAFALYRYYHHLSGRFEGLFEAPADCLHDLLRVYLVVW